MCYGKCFGQKPNQNPIWKTKCPSHRTRLQHDVDAVSLDDIKRVAAKYFRDQPYVLATVRPPEGSPAAKQK